MTDFELLRRQRPLFESMRVVSPPSLSITLTLIDAAHGFGEEAWMSAVPESVLAIRLRGAEVEKVSGARAGFRSRPSANWALQPKGTANTFRAGGPVTFGQIFMSDELLDTVSEKLERPAISGRLRDDLVFTPDAVMERRTADCIERCIDPETPATAVEAEGRVLLVLDRLHQLNDGANQPERFVAGLSPKRLRRVQEFLREHLAEDVRLVDLASESGQSLKHFARAFRQSTGMPPHRYLVHLRIEHAKDLLAKTKDPLSDIAANCGFADQSHFTATFRKVVGATPGEYRKEVQR